MITFIVSIPAVIESWFVAVDTTLVTAFTAAFSWLGF